MPTNLIVNGTFETGNFNNWSNVQPQNTMIVAPGYNGSSYCVGIGNYSSFSTLFNQQINTVINKQYTLSYYLKNVNGSQNVKFNASINNVVILGSSVDATSNFDWTKYSFKFTATTDTTIIGFNAFVHFLCPDYLRLDNISVEIDDTPYLTISSPSESVQFYSPITGYTLSTNLANPTYSISPSVVGTGLTFNTSTGLLSGTPNNIDNINTTTTYTITNTVANKSVTYALTTARPDKPVICVQFV
jgi:hypothetical protein